LSQNSRQQKRGLQIDEDGERKGWSDVGVDEEAERCVVFKEGKRDADGAES
jgi:hypothetical protein